MNDGFDVAGCNTATVHSAVTPESQLVSDSRDDKHDGVDMKVEALIENRPTIHNKIILNLNVNSEFHYKIIQS